MTRIWNSKPICECKDPLVPIPKSIYCMEPHPYVILGAPYGDNFNPWYLRSDVLRRLLLAQSYLSMKEANFKLALFDAWRPIEVQRFMVQYSIGKECEARGIPIGKETSCYEIKEITDKVNKFWASPSTDPLTPPPHSTGAAIDLTLSDLSGNMLDMGGDIDFMGNRSIPDYYAIAANDRESASFLFHYRRTLLATIMNKAGFVQHPNEWWHFSYGDQLWSWSKNSSNAIYGAIGEVNNFITNSFPICVT